MAIARANGKLKGKQPKLSARQRVHVLGLVRSGNHTIAELAELFSVSRATICREIARARRDAEPSGESSPWASADRFVSSAWTHRRGARLTLRTVRWSIDLRTSETSSRSAARRASLGRAARQRDVRAGGTAGPLVGHGLPARSREAAGSRVQRSRQRRGCFEGSPAALRPVALMLMERDQPSDPHEWETWLTTTSETIDRATPVLSSVEPQGGWSAGEATLGQLNGVCLVRGLQAARSAARV